MDAPIRCPECGTELPADSAGPGPCPACLLRLGLSGAIPAVEERPPVPPLSRPVTASAVATNPAPPRIAWLRIGLIGLAAVAVMALAFAALRIGPSTRSLPAELRLTILTPGVSDLVSFAISPDGSHVAFVADESGHPHLWLRPMALADARVVPGTEDASLPFWSPDSQHLAFFSRGTLRRIRRDGGAQQTIGRAPQPCGGAWAPDGRIVFAPDCEGPLVSVPAIGGEAQTLTSIDGGRESGHRFPQILPDGKVLFYADGAEETRGAYVFVPNSSEPRRLLDVETAPVYASPGYLLFARQGVLFARRFDANSLQTGEVMSLSEEVAVDPARRIAAIAASAAGPIVYRTGSNTARRQLAMLDQTGRQHAMMEPDAIGAPAVSPDGRFVALSREVNGNTDIWISDQRRETTTRFTFDEAAETRPVWSPDARTLIFHSTHDGAARVLRKNADGAGRETEVFKCTRRETVTDWSPDGRFLVYQHRGERGGWDLATMPIDGGRDPLPLLQTDADEMAAQFSPDGRWLAYQSNEPGRFEIFLRSFPDGETRAQVTTEGGTHPRWSLDGRTLYWLGSGGVLTGTRIMSDGGRSVTTDRVFQVFRGLHEAATSAPPYDVTPFGFVGLMATEGEYRPLTVLVNWNPR
jgi:Tol biopolymer transport system component